MDKSFPVVTVHMFRIYAYYCSTEFSYFLNFLSEAENESITLIGGGGCYSLPEIFRLSFFEYINLE